MPDESMTENQALGRLVSDSFVSRLWNRDPSLWPEPSPGGDLAEKTLGWLGLPLELSGLGQQFSSLHDQLVKDDFTDVVVLGMGGSSMTPLVLRDVFKEELSGAINIHTLDTVNPTMVSNLANQLDLEKTLFFVSSKSGTTVETLTLEAYFRGLLSPSEDIPADRRNWLALTDPGTPLSDRARAGEFGTWVSTPQDVGGRFSALTPFGMMPAAAIGLGLTKFAESATAMAQRCNENDVDNPGLVLGAFLAANMLAGRDKVTLITSEKYSSLGMWVDQLLAESTGKNGSGLIPVTGEPLLDPDRYGDDRQFVLFNEEGEEGLDDFASDLGKAGHPVHVIESTDSSPYQVAGEFFRWQVATAAASSVLGIYPFNQPDVEAAKVKARELLVSPGIEIEYASLDTAIDEIKNAMPPCYVAIAAFLHESDELTSEFSRLRLAISNITRLATTFGYGPRYLHSTGQLYKGGPQNAIVLGFVSGKYDHLAVPGESYTFGELTRAQAGGDFMVMSEGGQKVIPIEVGADPIADLKTVIQKLAE